MSQRYEYDVITQEDSFFTGRFSPDKLRALLNDRAHAGWRVISIAAGEHASLVGGKGQLLVVLERESKAAAEPSRPAGPSDAELGWDASRIPASRWYKDIGSIARPLVDAGLVTKEQVEQAREVFARKGGHFCDHVLALGFVSDSDLRRLAGK